VKILTLKPPVAGAARKYASSKSRAALIGRGHEVTVACPAHARMTAEAPRFGVPVVALPIEFKTVAGFNALRSFLTSYAPDVVNTHSSADSWLTGLACATLKNPPAIVRTRHISAPVSGNAFNRWLYRQARGVATTGESLRRHLLDTLGLDPSRVASVPTGIDTERFAPADKMAAKLALGLDPAQRHLGIVRHPAQLERPSLPARRVCAVGPRGPAPSDRGRRPDARPDRRESRGARARWTRDHGRPAHGSGTLAAVHGRVLPALLCQ
jgi:glycosyltransferase involved in cell wall biosynthesis